MKPRSHGGRSKTHALGQNFLIDVDVAVRIVEAAHVNPEEYVMEVGPGRGILTHLLAETGATILAVEKDPQLAAALIPQFASYKNVTIVVGDILQFDYQGYFGTKNFSIVANLPYSVGTLATRIFLEAPKKPNRMILMLQKEVAERMTAQPPHMSILSHVVAINSEASKLFDVPKEAFQPMPKVTSSVLSFTPRKEGLVTLEEYEPLLRLMKAGFSNKRKTLENALSGSLHLSKEAVRDILQSAHISNTLRAEALELKNWKDLKEILREKPSISQGTK